MSNLKSEVSTNHANSEAGGYDSYHSINTILNVQFCDLYCDALSNNHANSHASGYWTLDRMIADVQSGFRWICRLSPPPPSWVSAIIGAHNLSGYDAP